jgi:hypothetical protein
MDFLNCCEYLENNELPDCLNFNINKYAVASCCELPDCLNFNINKYAVASCCEVDLNKINYNDYTINIINQKKHKYLLKMPFYINYVQELINTANIEKPLKQLEEMNIILLQQNINNLHFDN